MKTAETYIPLPVEDYVRLVLDGDKIGQLSPQLRPMYENITYLPQYPNGTDWGEVVAEWEAERQTIDYAVEINRVRAIVARHWEQWEWVEIYLNETTEGNN